jgi:lysyl-tRNA synthetase, class II
MTTLSELRNARITKLEKLKALGVNPYPANSDRKDHCGEVVENFEKMEGKDVVLAGRIMAVRGHGKLMFFDLMDESGRVQLYIKHENLGEADYKNSELKFDDLVNLDVADFIEASGTVTKTKRGEVSVGVSKIRILSKAVRPLPEKREGLKNVEEKYRKRYLDLLMSKDAKKILDARWLITKEIRKFLWKEDFKEVETPVLQPLYGGTNARPFVTHLNALDRDFYLRIAPELYLKRLIVGGYERVFEIARNFRNEGIDQSHFPEFTMLEWYESYADYHRVMDLAEKMTKHLVKKLTGGTKVQVHGKSVDIGGEWPRKTVDEVLEEHLGISWDKVTDDEVKELQKKYKVESAGIWTKDKALFDIYDKVVTPKLVDPIWVIDYPMDICPLSKTHRSKENRAERFEGYVGGVEVFDGWSEIVSGLEQRKRFETEQANMREGDAEAMPLDEDFIETLEHGCPPLGGIGFGIDRIVMFLTDTWAIKQVVAFPILKPRKGEEKDE